MDIRKIQAMIDNEGVVFLTYGGFLSQELIAGMTEALEKETSVNGLSKGESNTIFTVFIELAQNLMNYSKTTQETSKEAKPEGLIVVGRENDDLYYIQSQNPITKEDKTIIEAKLEEVNSLTKDEIKKRYKELRRNGKNTHQKGGGIGFYEIGKRSDAIKYSFKKINEEKYYFQLKACIIVNKERKD